MCVSRSRMVIGRLAGTIDGAARTGHRHGGGGERRHEPAHRIGEPQPALFHERQHGGAGDGLGLRRDPEDRVHGHRPAGFLVAPADGALVDRLAVAQHQRHGAREPFLVHVALQQRVDAPAAARRRSPRAWRRRPSPRRGRRGELLRRRERGSSSVDRAGGRQQARVGHRVSSWSSSYRARRGRRPRAAILRLRCGAVEGAQHALQRDDAVAALDEAGDERPVEAAHPPRR